MAQVSDAVPSPLDVLLQLDSSASMLEISERASPRVSKWDAVRQAMEEFAIVADNGDLGLGLSYFPFLVPGVPGQCASNAECGAGGPCSNSVCVEPYQLVLPGLAPSTWLRQAADSNCATDAECPAGASCRPMVGLCTLPGGFVNLNPDSAQVLIPALCTVASDCLAGSTCEQVGVCPGAQLASCAAVNAPCASGEACVPIDFDCVRQTSCAVPEYELPAVPIAALASNVGALLDSLAARTPEGVTPTGPALQGALSHGVVWARQHPERQVAVIFATDGLPTTCAPLGFAELSALTASSRASAGQPLTLHVVGIFNGADLNNLDRAGLDELARAGGTSGAYLADTEGDVPRSLLNALRQIRSEAASCGFVVPDEARQRPADLSLELAEPTGARTQLRRVTGVEACEPRGWYYVRDGAGAPARIQICPGSCPSPFGTARLRTGFACEPSAAG